jgi:hypothetical protein
MKALSSKPKCFELNGGLRLAKKVQAKVGEPRRDEAAFGPARLNFVT